MVDCGMQVLVWVEVPTNPQGSSLHHRCVQYVHVTYLYRSLRVGIFSIIAVLPDFVILTRMIVLIVSIRGRSIHIGVIITVTILDNTVRIHSVSCKCCCYCLFLLLERKVAVKLGLSLLSAHGKIILAVLLTAGHKVTHMCVCELR